MIHSASILAHRSALSSHLEWSNNAPAVSGTYLPPAHATDYALGLVLTAEGAH